MKEKTLSNEQPESCLAHYKKEKTLYEKMLETFSKFTVLDMTKLGVDLRHEIGKDVKKTIKDILKEIQEEIDAVPYVKNINEVHKLHITSRLENIKKFIKQRVGGKLIK